MRTIRSASPPSTSHGARASSNSQVVTIFRVAIDRCRDSRGIGRAISLRFAETERCRVFVNFFVEPILANRNRDEAELFCYSDSDRRDAANARLRACADVWRDVLGIDDARDLSG